MTIKKLTAFAGGIALSLSFAGTASADNVTATTARTISINSVAQNTLSNVRTEVWYRVRLFANRSYQVSAWPVDHEQGVDVPAMGMNLFSDDGGTVAAAPAPTTTNGDLEGSPNSNGDALPVTSLFQPTATGVYKIKVSRVSGGAATGSINVMVRETTLFSPWLSKAAGFEGFIEIHNNTNAAVSVNLKGFDSTGTLQGAGLTVNVPPNATIFQTGATIGVPVNVAAGVVLTHNGAFGAISGNITTLNGGNGLSFDSAFTSRDGAIMGGPVR